jgi:UDP-glucose 4-epimerase
MAIHKFIVSMLRNEEVIVFGNGEQTRDFTYIDDVVEASILALESKCVGEVFNIGGGTKISVNNLIKQIEKLLKIPAKIKYIECQKGDVKDTLADISKAKKLLSYEPKFNIENGLKNQIDWINHRISLFEKKLIKKK